ncbi:hypothetical protein bpuCAU1_001320 (plasmid) [Borrelia puertoricensis]|uniref:hypothetical protein n=1 Tax=Borrelia puertoricensis TaxID=2756107 RepID=UPI001FF3541F|nr:hypothetical protein [Borrelia puertoricensis]UPA19106.1 hypothetical protein bpuSUM_001652 [Borrelia puertoricensis]
MQKDNISKRLFYISKLAIHSRIYHPRLNCSYKKKEIKRKIQTIIEKKLESIKNELKIHYQKNNIYTQSTQKINNIKLQNIEINTIITEITGLKEEIQNIKKQTQEDIKDKNKEILRLKEEIQNIKEQTQKMTQTKFILEPKSHLNTHNKKNI